MKKIYLIGSSSGGHVYPLIGLYELIKDEYEVVFIGIKGEFEENVFPKNSIFLNIENSFKKILKNKKAFKKEIKLVKEIINKDDLIISSGGISSYIARSINKGKLIILEQNRILGDSNIYAAFKAKKILTSFDLLFNPFFYKTEKIINPSIYRIKNIKDNKENNIVFVFGSLSSSTLIKKTILYFNSSLCIDSYNYILIAGKYYKDIIKIDLPKNVIIYEKIEDFSILKSAKMVFTRGGATTLSELNYFNINYVIIPSPYVKHNHQLLNAKYMNKKYKIPYILEKNYSPLSIYKIINSTKEYIDFNVDNNKYIDIKEVINGLI